MMNRISRTNGLWVTIAALMGVGLFLAFSGSGVLAADKSAAESEKEKAMKSPYPNDLGPDKIDDVVKTYPADKQVGYKVLLVKCAQCHTSARPLNSKFLELEGKDDAAQKAKLDKLKASNPEIFKDSAVWQADVKIWSRYVKRMMAKPGCKIEPADGKKIYEFLVHDGMARKTGANAKKWEEHRKKLLSQFKEKYPARYKELEEHKGL